MKKKLKALKAEELENRAAPLSIATTEPILDTPVEARHSSGGEETPNPPCFSPKSSSPRGPIVYIPE